MKLFLQTAFYCVPTNPDQTHLGSALLVQAISTANATLSQR